MRAAVLNGVGALSVEDVEISAPLAGEVLVRTTAVGLCHSDVHFIDGSLPMAFPAVLGHEAAGVVEAVGADVADFAPGDRVVVSLVTACGACRFCKAGQQHLCRDQSVRVRGQEVAPRLSLRDGTPVYQGMATGAFAEQMLVHHSSLVHVPDNMPLDLAALLGCAVSTGVGASLHRAQIAPGETVAVLGCGAVGLSAIVGAAIAGASRIIAIDIAADKLQKARDFGATDLVNASETNAVEAVMALTDGGVDHSIEAIGRPETMTQAVQMIRRAGTATLLGVMAAGASFSLDGMFILDEKRVQGAFMGAASPVVAMPAYFEYFLNGQLPLEDLVARRIRLDEISEGIAALASGQPGRQLIVFEN
jgi:S-(hydroxymethyl)glutathione dehydrogenase / alcohol dehydrogenase